MEVIEVKTPFSSAPSARGGFSYSHDARIRMEMIRNRNFFMILFHCVHRKDNDKAM